MKLNLLLHVLVFKLKRAAGKNERFKKFIQNKELKFAIRTMDGKTNRVLGFSNGRIVSCPGHSAAIDFAMVWSDADTAFAVMSSSNEEASVAALTEKKLQVEGDLKAFMWFSRAVGIMMGKA